MYSGFIWEEQKKKRKKKNLPINDVYNKKAHHAVG